MSFTSSIQRLAIAAARRFGGQHYEFLNTLADEAAISFFRQRVGKSGPGLRIRHPIYLWGPQYVKVGRNFSAQPGLRIEAIDGCGDDLFSPQIVIGDNVFINFDVHIGAIGHLEIGDSVLIGSHVLITDHAHGRTSPESLDGRPILRPLVWKKTVIESNAWIGEGACILAGVRVGRNAVIGANAVVTHDVPPATVVAGVPARILMC